MYRQQKTMCDFVSFFTRKASDMCNVVKPLHCVIIEYVIHAADLLLKMAGNQSEFKIDRPC